MTFESLARARRIGGAVIMLTAAGLTLIALTRTPPAPVSDGPSQKIARAAESTCESATTIRNGTDRTITYTICPPGHPDALQIHRIAPGAIDCFPTATSLEIEFHVGEKEVTYALDPGKPYAFRHDEGTKIGLFLGSHGRSDAVDLAPFVPTPGEIVDRMLKLAGITKEDVVYDIGCGDGRIVIAAARDYGARGVGVDLDRSKVEDSLANARKAGVEPLVKFICMDATKADVSEATVVTLYLISESNALLRPLLEKQLRPGSRVVSHNYPITGWENRQTGATSMKDAEGKDHTIYVYVR